MTTHHYTTSPATCIDGHSVPVGTRMLSGGRIVPAHCPTCTEEHQARKAAATARREAGNHDTHTTGRGRWTKCYYCGLRVGAGVDISDYPCRVVNGMQRRTVTTTSRDCSDRCLAATRFICECRCGGINHGRG